MESGGATAITWWGHACIEMVTREAALAIELLGVREVLPIHYGTFPILAGTPSQLRDELAARSLHDVTVHDLQPGQTLHR